MHCDIVDHFVHGIIIFFAERQKEATAAKRKVGAQIARPNPRRAPSARLWRRFVFIDLLRPSTETGHNEPHNFYPGRLDSTIV